MFARGAELSGEDFTRVDWADEVLSEVRVDIGQALAIAAAQGVQIS